MRVEYKRLPFAFDSSSIHDGQLEPDTHDLRLENLKSFLIFCFLFFTTQRKKTLILL
jgi:hypothetical protein